MIDNVNLVRGSDCREKVNLTCPLNMDCVDIALFVRTFAGFDSKFSVGEGEKGINFEDAEVESKGTFDE